VSGNRKPGANGKLPPVGDTVDVATATWTNTIGASELAAVWKDPDFKPDQRAFYYARVIEIPTPRWTAYDQVRFGIKMSKEVPRAPGAGVDLADLVHAVVTGSSTQVAVNHEGGSHELHHLARRRRIDRLDRQQDHEHRCPAGRAAQHRRRHRRLDAGGWFVAPLLDAGTINKGDFSLGGLFVSLVGAVILLRS